MFYTVSDLFCLATQMLKSIVVTLI